LYTSQASFGPLPPMDASNNPSRIVTLSPESNSLLCDNITSVVSGSSSTKTIMLVPRGECTFEVKAHNAQLLGADAILIYGTLASRYNVNKTKHGDEKYPSYDLSDIIYPRASFDYDCQKGRAEIPAPDIRLQPLPYNSEHNDPILTGDNDDNLCKLYSPTQLRECPSKMCLLTGNFGKNDDASKLEVCCAWDLHVWLYKDISKNTTITIPASYLTMEQGLQLLNDVQAGNVQAVLYSRHRPDYNFSSILIWALGVFVAALAAYLSAGDYHHKIKNVLSRAQARASSDDPRRSRRKDNASNDGLDQTPLPVQEDTLELSPIHALGFIIMASAGLFILFFFKIYNFVKVMYAFGCSSAVVQVITLPLVKKIAKRLRFRDFTVWKTGTADFGDISYLEIIAFFLGYGLGFSWLYVAFFVRHPGDYVFFWVLQDVMGACMCITFLSIIKLNSIKVAAVLLTAAFLYDIFMVFVTPYIFAGKSVMIIVATSGGPPKADPSWCEKYPDDADCQGGDPLPMLLTMPRIGDYMGGSSLLGLGDIVCE
jgi:signal peptide peptidase-like protein 2B